MLLLTGLCAACNAGLYVHHDCAAVIIRRRRRILPCTTSPRYRKSAAAVAALLKRGQNSKGPAPPAFPVADAADDCPRGALFTAITLCKRCVAGGDFIGSTGDAAISAANGRRPVDGLDVYGTKALIILQTRHFADISGVVVKLLLRPDYEELLAGLPADAKCERKYRAVSSRHWPLAIRAITTFSSVHVGCIRCALAVLPDAAWVDERRLNSAASCGCWIGG